MVGKLPLILRWLLNISFLTVVTSIPENWRTAVVIPLLSTLRLDLVYNNQLSSSRSSGNQLARSLPELPACRRLLFPLLHAEKGNRRRLHAGNPRGEEKAVRGSQPTSRTFCCVELVRLKTAFHSLRQLAEMLREKVKHISFVEFVTVMTIC